jgi:hypothetical protein
MRYGTQWYKTSDGVWRVTSEPACCPKSIVELGRTAVSRMHELHGGEDFVNGLPFRSCRQATPLTRRTRRGRQRQLLGVCAGVTRRLLAGHEVGQAPYGLEFTIYCFGL